MLLLSSNSKNSKTALKKSDVDFYKMSGVFALACFFIILVLKMNSSVLERHASGKNLTYNFYMLCRNPFFIALSAAVAIAGIAWFIYCRVKKTDESLRIFSSFDAAALVVYAAVFWLCFGLELNSARHMFFVAFTVIISVLYFISKLYKADFLFYSVLNAFFAMILYFFAENASPVAYAVKIISIAAAVVACVLFRKKFSSVKKGKRGMLFAPAYISLAIGAVFLFWRMFTINSPLFLTVNAMLIILFVQYLVAAIIYTIKLIRE